MLKGLVFSGTGFRDEWLSSIAAKCSEMKGTFQINLKSGTHFLLVGHWNSSKVFYASRQRIGLTFLRPEFMDYLYDLFCKGEPVDLDAIIRQFRLPPLFGLVISTSGLKAEAETLVIKIIGDNGGVYASTVSRRTCDIVVSKRIHGDRYDQATRQGIPVVHPTWLDHCFKRRSLVDPTRYHPALDDFPTPLQPFHPDPWIFLAHSLSNRRKGVLFYDADCLRDRHVFFVGLSSIQNEKLKSLASSVGAILAASEGDASDVIVHPKLYKKYAQKYHQMDVWRLASSFFFVEMIELFVLQERGKKRPGSGRSGFGGGSSCDLPFSGYKICISGFSDKVHPHVTKLIALLGAIDVRIVCGMTTDFLLVGPCASTQTVQSAYECRVPVVPIDWLWDSALSGYILDEPVYHMGLVALQELLTTPGIGEVAYKRNDGDVFPSDYPSSSATHNVGEGSSGTKRKSLGKLGTDNTHNGGCYL